jgi:DNA uptake protein ComE-like DNA-binding protein
MMMVVAVMAEALHLIQTLSADPLRCQMLLRPRGGAAENGAVHARSRCALGTVAILLVCLAGLAQNQDRDTRGTPKTSTNAPAAGVRVDINHATVEELAKVPGLTRSWAGRIVRFRPYRTKGDLLERGVVTSEVYERIKDYVIAHREGQ